MTNLLAGVYLVKLEKVYESSLEQIQSDLAVNCILDGLIICWDY